MYGKRYAFIYVSCTCGNELGRYNICVGFFFDKMYVWTEWLGSMIGRVGCPKKHESCQMKLHMEILVPIDIKVTSDFFQEF